MTLLRPFNTFAWTLVACGVLTAAPARAQSAPVLLLLDDNAIAANRAPNMFAPIEINATIAAVSGEIPWTATGTSLKGATLGALAFSIGSVTSADGIVPSVTVRVMDVNDTCSSALTLVSF